MSFFRKEKAFQFFPIIFTCPNFFMKKTQNFWDGKNPFPPWHLLPLGSPKLSSLRSSKGKNCLIPTSFLAGDRSTRIAYVLDVLGSPPPKPERKTVTTRMVTGNPELNLAKCHWLGGGSRSNLCEWRGLKRDIVLTLFLGNLAITTWDA